MQYERLVNGQWERGLWDRNPDTLPGVYEGADIVVWEDGERLVWDNATKTWN